MKKLLFFAFLPMVSLAQIPSGYYDGTDGLNGYALKSKVHEIISKQIYSTSYDDLKTLFGTTDTDKYYENDNTLLDIYSEKPKQEDAYNYTLANLIGSASAEGQGWNREHGVPQSTFNGIYPMYSDLHYLIPTDAYINQRRSNFPYARNNGENITFTNGSKLGKSTTPGYTNTVYEPIDEFKGDVARYLLYFVVRYEGNLNNFDYLLSTSPLDGTEEKGYEDWYINLLKEWNTLDPVSQREIDRNESVYSIQKIRNPFIDHPEWVNMIWNVTPDQISPQNPTNLIATTISDTFITLNWQPSADSDILGYKIYVNGEFYKRTKYTTTTIDRLSPSTAYNITVKAYDNGYLLSNDSNVLSVSTISNDNLANDLMITKYIEGTSYNKALEITNLSGHEIDLGNYYLRTQLKSSSFYFGEAFELEGKLEAGKSLVVIHPNATISGYSISQAKFITNSPLMSFSGTQYIELSYGNKYLSNSNTNNYEIDFQPVDVIGVQDVSNSYSNISLYRNVDVKNPNSTFTISEWTSYPTNYANGLGTYLGVNEELVPNQEIVIYPNPTTDILYFRGKELNKVSKAQIYNIYGNLIKEIENPFNFVSSIDISDLEVGIYFIRLNQNSIKFIKK